MSNSVSVGACIFDHVFDDDSGSDPLLSGPSESVASLVKTFFRFSKEFDNGDVSEATFGNNDVDRFLAGSLGADAAMAQSAQQHRRNRSKASYSSSLSMEACKPTVRMFCRKSEGLVAIIFAAAQGTEEEQEARQVADRIGTFFGGCRGDESKMSAERLVAFVGGSSGTTPESISVEISSK